MNRCETCKSWCRAGASDSGRCYGVEYAGTVYRTEDCGEARAITLDGEGFDAVLLTRRDFGCVLHEPAGETMGHPVAAAIVALLGYVALVVVVHSIVHHVVFGHR